MKKASQPRKLQLAPEVIVHLTHRQLQYVAGGSSDLTGCVACATRPPDSIFPTH
jgi:hypothetical protein